MDYNFVTREAFLKLKDEGGFIETAEFGSNLYGTSVKAVEDVKQGKVKGAEAGNNSPRICVLDIEMEGVKQVLKTDLNARVVFIAPPSMEVLEKRLKGRGTESDDSLKKRLGKAQQELDFAKSHKEKIIVNDEVERAYKELENFIVDGGKWGS